jgi:uncharacterized protein (TIGR03437 family)
MDGNSEIFLYEDGATLKQITSTTPNDISRRILDGNFQPSLTDDGRFIAFSSNRNLTNQNPDGNLEIFIFDAASNTFAQLTNTAGTVGASDARISGNAARVAYIRDNNTSPGTQRDLVLQDRSSGTVRLITSNATNLAFTYGRAISDDGARLVYSADTAADSSQVFLFDGRISNSTRQITALGVRTNEMPLHPTISGDGTRIAFATRRPVVGISNTDNSIEVYTFDIPTGEFASVTNAPSNADGFDGSNRVAEVVSSLSDDGSVVAFNFPRSLSGAVSGGLENNSEIYVSGTAARPAFGTLTVLNYASFGNEPSTTKAIAPDSITVALGSALAFTTEQAAKQPDGSFPTTLGGTTVTVGGRRAQISFVSPTQIHFIVPAQTEVGTAEVFVTNAEGFQSRGMAAVLRAAPGIFTVSGDGRGEAMVTTADGLHGTFDPTSGNLRLVIFSTGVRHATQVTATAGGRALAVESFMASPDMAGLDEIRVLVPSDLRGAGTIDLVVRADGRDSNPVSVIFSGDARRDIVINEVLANPPAGLAGDANRDGVRDSSDDEFIEIVNTTASDIDISGYQLLTRSTGATTDTTRHTFAQRTIFPAGSAIVVFGGGAFKPDDPVFGGAKVFKANTGALSLTNSGGVVTLLDTKQAIVNIFSYGGSTGLSGNADQSLTRSPDINGNFTPHTTANGSNGRSFSPGTHVDGSPFSTIAIARLEVTPASVIIDSGAKQQFTAKAYNASGDVISGVIFFWQSSNTSVTTIDRDGLAGSLSPGQTNITASARSVQSPPAILTVRELERVLTRVDVTPNPATIPTSGTQQFIAHGFDQFGNEITGLTFTFESTDTTVATIDQSGLANGLRQGQTTIKATSGGATGTATLSVTPPTVIFNELLADPVGSATTDTQGDANHDGVRSSGDDEFVELVNSAGEGFNISGWKIITRAASGLETTRHTFAAGTTLPTGEAIVVFGGGNFNPSDAVFGCAQVLKASSGGLSLTNGGLTIIVRDASNNLVTQFSYGGTTGPNGDNDQSLTRSPDITGNFVQHTAATAAGSRRFSPGTRAGGTPFGNCPSRLTSITISPQAVSILAGQSAQFTAQALDQFGQPMTAASITFASDNTSAATIDSVASDINSGIITATITGHNPGTAHITASATDGTTIVSSAPAALTVEHVVNAGEVLISEFRTRGPGGTSDEFIELYNPTSSSISIEGLKIIGSNATGGTSTRATIAAGATLGSGCHYLLAFRSTNCTNCYSGTVTPDQTYSTAIADDGGIAITRADATTLIDQVGMSQGSAYREGAPLTPLLTNLDQSYERKPGGAYGNGTDTNNNASDFFLNASSSNPQNLSSGCLDLSKADLGITKTASPDPVTTGSDVTYTINVANNGAADAQSVVVTDDLPASLTFVSCLSTGGGVCGGTGNNRTVTFSSLASGDSATITLVATANSAGGTTISNTATVASTTPDPNTGNNSAAVTTTVQAVAPTLHINDVTITEGDSGTKTIDFTITLSASSTQIVTVVYATSSAANPATATAGTDYQSTSGTLTFNPGETGKTVTVIINGDTLVEPDETFFVNLSGATNATITDAQGVGTIINDDAANLVISQIYGGGGNSGAPLTNDFIEIFNRGTTTVDLAGWSVQYNSASGTDAWSVTQLCPNGLCLFAPGRYFLVREGATGATNLPAPDAVGTIAMATTSGKVALVNKTTALTGACPSSSTSIADLAGYGGSAATSNFCFEGSAPAPAPASNNSTADFRKSGGCIDTNDNAADFTTAAPAPRNTSSSTNNCAAPATNPRQANLSLTKTAAPDPVTPGGTLTYTITVNNNGPDTAQNLTVTDNLPATLTFASCTAPGGSCNNAGNNVTATYSSLANGASATITLQATVSNSAANGSTITNTATVGSDTFDQNPGNNTATTTISVQAATPPSADLSLTKTVNNSTPNIGEKVTYTITVSNAGPIAATGVQVTDLLPSGLQYVNSNPGQGAYNQSTGVWTVGTLSISNPAATLTITATVLTTGAKTNTAEVTASGATDPDSTPNNHNANEDDQASVSLTGASNLVVNEALVAQQASPPADAKDFVEIYNRSSQPIDVSGLVITYRLSGTPAAPGTFTIPGNTLIPSAGYLLIANGSSAYGKVADFDASGNADLFNLNNSNGGIKIELNGVKLDGLAYRSGAGAVTSPYDTYGEGNPFIGVTSSGLQDIIRSPTSSDTNDNAIDFRRNGTVNSVSAKASNP